MSTEHSPLLKELFENTDLISETLSMLDDTITVNEISTITENMVSLPKDEIESTINISDTRDKIDQIISKSIEIKPIMFKSEKPKDESIKVPIENALITSDLFEDFVNKNSFTLNEKLSILFTVINCAFLTKTNPSEFPKFGSFLRNFKMDVFNSKQIKTIRKYYSKIIKQAKN